MNRNRAVNVALAIMVISLSVQLQRASL